MSPSFDHSTTTSHRLAFLISFYIFFFNDTATTEIYTLSLHDALPIWPNPSATSGTVIFTNTVTSASGTPTNGTVTFYDNGTNTLGTGTLNGSGVATLT